MKFTTATILAIASLASVASADSNLRAAANKFLQSSSTDLADARIVIHGLTKDASPEDLEIIGKSAVAAYNSAYETVGYSMGSFNAQSSAPVPDMVKWMPDCRFCPPDDDTTALEQNSNEQGELVLARVKVGWTPDCRFLPSR
jgi:hypothetical protein